jgi:hypothetical protein
MLTSNEIQFARVVAELDNMDVLDNPAVRNDLADRMSVDREQITGLIERAHATVDDAAQEANREGNAAA